MADPEVQNSVKFAVFWRLVLLHRDVSIYRSKLKCGINSIPQVQFRMPNANFVHCSRDKGALMNSKLVKFPVSHPEYKGNMIHEIWYEKECFTVICQSAF